ncbi:universal stress protein [Desulfococcus sp.]|uniref:universal stress protein n=1 Tax=Desulfococcus sp. TaxID=2025834 RepID=UPI0035938C6A
MKILLGYDGSNAAMAALKLAVKHGKAFNGTVFVIHSLAGGTEDNEEKIAAASDQLAFAEGLIQEAGVSCETHLLVRGLPPGEDIIRFAEENKIDTIIIGVRRRSQVGKLLFGSTAAVVILNAPCPVITTR